MPHKIDGIQHYTKAEIDQLLTGGYVGSLANRNALPVVISAGSWTQQSGGNQDGWYYADVTHGRTTPFAVVHAIIGASNRIEIVDGTNFIQDKLTSTTIRLWIFEEPAYDLLCLVLYA